MKVQLFGKEMEIKKELIVFIASGLVLLGVLAGSFMFSSRGDIIIEDGQILPEPGRDSTYGSSAGNGYGGTAEVSYSGAAGDAAGVGGNATGAGSSGNSGNSGETAGPDGGSAENKDEIKVYVVGCVKNPGIVTLTKGQMICDAVREAGGLTEDADADNINMVYSLNENVMLVIKSKNENNAAGEGALVRSDSGPGAEVIGSGDDTPAGRNGIKPVNINTAGIDELDTLPGIGEAKARDIIAYREKHGRFNRIEDIMKVPGIKQNRFESIKDYITVD
ncbi:MAG TPA: helix-hairpin-helix domain-containing protein [Clostridiales bacterium]|mgnify:FL=1|nr:helix-hairpin-helix domain-containing protein [Clostridiales bacterium]HPV02477.1 helix-hairpin-helix domain-containing protein [Clostridiales bacterium]